MIEIVTHISIIALIVSFRSNFYICLLSILNFIDTNLLPHAFTFDLRVHFNLSSGAINMEEFKDAIMDQDQDMTDEDEAPITADEVTTIITGVDVDGDGQVNLEGKNDNQ